MTQFDQYLVWGGVLFLLLCLIFLLRWQKGRKASKRERMFIFNALEEARQQKALMDIKLRNDTDRTGLSAFLEAIDRGSLVMFVNGFVPDDWNKKLVEVFFRVTRPDGVIFYVFNSNVSKLVSGPKTSAINIAFPTHLRVEKKRHFIRVTPDPADVLMLAIWPVAPGKRLPRARSDMGAPELRWKSGDAEQHIQLENISGGGVALRLQAGTDGFLPFALEKGKQLICLLVYKPEPDTARPLIFWCSCEISNIRKNGHAISIGMEFTNWALQEQEEHEIHWIHSSPWQGAKPILKWVEAIDKHQIKASGG